MIRFPIAKINIGLNIVGVRSNGYHDLETVFYPVGLRDALEVYPMDEAFPSETNCDIKVTNIAVEGEEKENLVVRAYRMLAERYSLPRLHVHLYKGIPTQAGLGGGSSDCAQMIVMLNELAGLGLSQQELMDYGLRLGADCPFFVMGKPAYGEGIGERLEPVRLDLSGHYVCIVKPQINVSTREAFSLVTPRKPERNCRDIVAQPLETWRGLLRNDFEESVFALHPEIGHIKERLYEEGAVYSSMSGSGSSVYGIFDEERDLSGVFEGMFCKTLSL